MCTTKTLMKVSNLQINILDHPVLKVLTKVNDTHLLQDVQFPSPVKVQDAIKSSGMTVKIILIFLQRKCIAKVQYLKRGSFLYKQ